MADVMIRWHIVTSAEYAAGTKVDGDLYFLSDTHEIYRGTESFTTGVELYETALPSAPAKGRLYINKTSLQGQMWDGSAWTVVAPGVATAVTADGSVPVTGKAVADYITEQLAQFSTSSNSVKSVSYDETEHMMTVTKGDDSADTFVLGGLGCSISFANNTLQLLDASGNTIGDAVNLDVERFVTGGEYVEADKTIVLYFDGKTGDESTDKVAIPVGDLVDVYTVSSSGTIDLEMAANNITAALKISAETGNAVVVKADGIYVPSVDTSGFMTKVAGATEGNLPVLTADGELIDSGINPDSLGQATLYQGTGTIEEAVGEATPKKGDVCVISTAIGETDKVSKTAYFFNGSAWVAMDGNVNATNVYFPADLTTTSAIGNITLTNGQATIAAAGKSLQDVWNSIFIKEKNPSTTQPSVSLTASANKAYEVGETVTPTYTATLKAGSYTYGPVTGITATSWSVTDSDGHSKTTNTGSFDAFVVGDDTNYTITATATYGDGAIPVTNTGNPYAAGQIKAGSKSATSAAITGYRRGFYGYTTNKTDAIDSALIRGLQNKTDAAPKAGDYWEVEVPVGAKRVVFAYPATVRDVNSALDDNGLKAESKTAFTKHTIDVEGYNGYDAASYKVYIMEYTEEGNGTANKFLVTL